MSDTQRTTKPAEVELLPCPFCGGAPGVVHTTDVDDTKWVHVECYGCGARTRGDWIPPSSDQCPIFFQEVRAEWNRRANVSHATAPLQAEVEALREAMSDTTDEIYAQRCNGSGRITTVEQYLKTLPANWHEDSGLATWFPITAEEIKRLRARIAELEKALREVREHVRDLECYECVVCINRALRTTS